MSKAYESAKAKLAKATKNTARAAKQLTAEAITKEEFAEVKAVQEAAEAKLATMTEKVVEKDQFGFRPGSDRSKLLAALSTEPKTPAQLQEESGVEKSHPTALRVAVATGLVVKEGHAYRLANGKKPAKKSKKKTTKPTPEVAAEPAVA